MLANATPWCRPAAARRGWFLTVGAASLLTMMIVTSSCAGAHSLNAQSSWDGQRITGQVKNNGPSKVGCVVVEYALVNRQGGSLRTVSTTKQDGLAAQDTWDFAINGASAAGATSTRLTKLQAC